MLRPYCHACTVKPFRVKSGANIFDKVFGQPNACTKALKYNTRRSAVAKRHDAQLSTSHMITDRQTDKRQYDANSRSYCVNSTIG